jgi:hypothetical protein
LLNFAETRGDRKRGVKEAGLSFLTLESLERLTIEELTLPLFWICFGGCSPSASQSSSKFLI